MSLTAEHDSGAPPVTVELTHEQWRELRVLVAHEVVTQEQRLAHAAAARLQKLLATLVEAKPKPAAGGSTDEDMQEAIGGACCARHAALGQHPVDPLDGPCGPLRIADLGTMTAVAHEGLRADNPRCYARGALRAVLVLCATLAPALEARS